MAETQQTFTPYEKTHRLRSLLLVVTIVGKGQADAILSLATKYESNLNFVETGKGTAPNNLYAILGSAPLKKDVIFSVMKETSFEGYAKELEARFKVSAMAKGVCFCIKLDAVAGVSVYKMLSNTRYFEKPNKKMKGRHEQ